MKNQETKDLVFKQLDMIYNAVEDTAKQFGTKIIPTNLIEKAVNIGKIDIKKLSKDTPAKGFFIEYNKLLDEVVTQCKKDASDMSTTKIPLLLFESHIDVIKSSFKTGLN